MIPRKMYCRQCGRKMSKTSNQIDSKTVILFTCPNIKYPGDAMTHDQSSFVLSSKQVANWEGA